MQQELFGFPLLGMAHSLRFVCSEGLLEFQGWKVMAEGVAWEADLQRENARFYKARLF